MKIVFAIIGAMVICIIIGVWIKIHNHDINMWKNTPAWKLSLAVKHQNSARIAAITKSQPDLLNYQEPRNGITLLIWAVGREKYASAEALLQSGADPNIASTRAGETALFVAAGTSWVNTQAHLDPKYVKLLLKYGADPDRAYVGLNPPDDSFDIIESGTSPLFHSIRSHPLVCCIEKTKALIEGGADINAKTVSGRTAAVAALLAGSINSPEEMMEYAYYLIAVKRANITDPYHRLKIFALPGADMNENFYAVDILRDWIPELDSKGHQMKMKIVKEFARQGVDYYATEVPEIRLEHIKELYPNTWKEYVEQY